MDAVQFGRWLSERRHARGWPSQRALADAALAEQRELGADLSEAFLARLEAGHLAHPFRGVVRRRVLALAWLLCKTPRDVRGYLRAAGLMELSGDESSRVDRLMRHLAPARPAGPLILPPRPPRLLGRDDELASLTRALTSTGVVAVTGMPGIGKSALAAELIHRLAEHEREFAEMFPDGIVWVSAAGWRGPSGLAALLHAVAAALSPSGGPAIASAQHARGESSSNPQQDIVRRDAWESDTGDRWEAHARAALGDRRVLLVLDDVDAALPLREALAVLLAQSPSGARPTEEPDIRAGHRAVLLTSRYLPAPALLTAHLHLSPLAPPAALALFSALVGHSLTDPEREAASLACAALGHLPVAIAAAATAAAARGIALPLLAARVSERPLDALLDGDGTLRQMLAQALDPLPAHIQQRFALLGALGAPSFGLEPIAAIETMPPEATLDDSYPDAPSAAVTALIRDVICQEPSSAPGSINFTSGHLATVANDLGHLVRTSLLDAVPLPAISPRFGLESTPRAGLTHYHLHPVLAAYALERLEQLDPEVTRAARRNVQEYALVFVEHHQSEPRLLERERDLLLAVLTRAWDAADYRVVVRLVSGLWHLISRVGSYAITARTLAWGITASQELNDQYHLARFMGRLGSLLYYHGDAGQARRTWESSLEIAEHLRGPSDLWHPLANLAMLACLEGDFTRAQRYAESYLRRAEHDSGGIPAVAGALFKRGVCAHLEGDLDQAYADLSACTRLLALRGAGDKVAHDGIFEMAAQAELARVQGDFSRAQHHMEIAVALAEEVCDHYVVADLLLDQARFARLQERQEEARVLARRVVEVATQVEAHQLRLEGLSLLRQLPAAAPRLSS